jgi:hypothetical protein
MFGRKQKEIDSLMARVCELSAKLSVYERAQSSLDRANERLDESWRFLMEATDLAKEFKEDLLLQYESMFLRWKEGMAELMTLNDLLKRGVYAIDAPISNPKRKK